MSRRSAGNRLGSLLVSAGLAVWGAAAVQPQSGPTLVPAPPPPMGWSSWNSFSNTVDSQVIVDQAKAMVSTGMAKAGYQYVNIDEGWWLGERDADGHFVIDAKAWPALAAGDHAGDMANIVRFIHGLGLKAGIYTDAGKDGCSMYPDLGPPFQHTGSEGHYEQDFLQFARWGFDYVKVDWCGGDKEKLDPAVQYAEIARAIAKAEAATGRRLYFSLCEWGNNSPWTWAPNVGGAPAAIWRTSGDIVAPIVPHREHSGRLASFPGVLSNFDQGIHPEAQHTGFYNDPDMMVVGMPGLTDAQNRVHMSLWAISAAPLLVGADLTTLSDATRATLTHIEVLAVDQDPLGLQGVKVASSGSGLEVWSKALAPPGERAVLLLNRSGDAASITARWADLGLDESSSATVRDLWAGKDLGSFKTSYSVTVGSNDAVLVVVRGREGKLTTYSASAGGGMREGEELSFAHVASRVPMARVRIAYTNPGKTPRYAALRVNGSIATRVAFPPTGSGNAAGAIWIEALLDREGANNTLVFSAMGDSGPGIESISVE
ncbi:MAG: alpha-galactosidase [Terracidiphilus sp.]|nr:alpha-galactosidase [Terracidiphilus sp.]